MENSKTFKVFVQRILDEIECHMDGVQDEESTLKMLEYLLENYQEICHEKTQNEQTQK